MTNQRPVEAFPPGEYLKDELEERGWTQSDFAEILGRPLRLVNQIIKAKKAITPETAEGLSRALGTSAQLWLNLEAAYQLSKIPVANGDEVSRRARLYSAAPIKEMIRRHWIEGSKNLDELEQRVLAFLGTTTPDEKAPWAWAAKKSTSYHAAYTPAQAAWFARVRHLAEAVSVSEYADRNVGIVCSNLKELMHTPEETRHIPRKLADAGIRFLIVEPLAGTRIDGVSFWLDERSPVIALSLRFDRIDHLWYVLFHELGHTQSKDALTSTPYLDIDSEKREDTPGKPEAEQAADRFAVEALVPQRDLVEFASRVRPLFSSAKIQGFAARMGVHPGIVVGQLQFRHEISYAHHRRLLSPIRHDVIQSTLTDGWGHIPPITIT